MENKHLSLPQERGYDRAYELSYRLAGEQLAKIDNVEEQCRKSGAEYHLIDSRKEIIIQYLNRRYRITLPDAEVSLVDSPEKVDIRDKLLILHYFNTAKGTPPTNRLVTFRELPAGNVYFPTFQKRTVEPIVRRFAKDPGLLLTAGEKLGGRKADYGDMAVIIDAFRRVPVAIILWRGDDEFPPRGNVLFDANIPDYLLTEDTTVLCETIVWRLVRFVREA